MRPQPTMAAKATVGFVSTHKETLVKNNKHARPLDPACLLFILRTLFHNMPIQMQVPH